MRKGWKEAGHKRVIFAAKDRVAGGSFSDERTALLRDSVNERAFSEKGLTNCFKFGAEKLREENEHVWRRERFLRE